MVKEYWSAYDEETHNDVASGMNSPSLKKAVEDVFDMWAGSIGEDEDTKQMRKFNWKEKRFSRKHKLQFS